MVSYNYQEPTIFKDHDEYEEASLFSIILVYISCASLAIMGHINDLFRRISFFSSWCSSLAREKGNANFVPLYSDFDAFFIRNFYRRSSNCWNRPITGKPGRFCQVLERKSDDFNWSFYLTGKVMRCLNLGSYNYLGFASDEDIYCMSEEADKTLWDGLEDLVSVPNMIKHYGTSPGSPLLELGTYPLLQELEAETARFLGTESAMVVGMGYATNSTIIPSLVSQGCLVLSDSLNHTSLIMGCRLSGATTKIFRHNDIDNLELLLKNAILRGQPVKHSIRHKPWRKILIIVEGIYSMEGAIVKLPDIIALKKKYNAYLYLDEAHSIGALGKTGRGVCEYWEVSPNDVDVMMGTFTKSFGAAGGYVAGKRDLIESMRYHSFHSYYATSMSVPVAAQVLKVIQLLDRPLGAHRIAALHRNTRYFREKLIEMGFIIYGDDNSPVVPLLLYYPGAVGIFSTYLLERKIAIVVVGYPATPLLTCRARFCLNGSHTIEELDYALTHISAVGDLLGLKFKKNRKLQKIMPK